MWFYSCGLFLKILNIQKKKRTVCFVNLYSYNAKFLMIVVFFILNQKGKQNCRKFQNLGLNHNETVPIPVDFQLLNCISPSISPSNFYHPQYVCITSWSCLLQTVVGTLLQVNNNSCMCVDMESEIIEISFEPICFLWERKKTIKRKQWP